VHFANATIAAPELRTQGYGAPTEAFGEFFRQAFSDPRWLFRYRAVSRRVGKTGPVLVDLSAATLVDSTFLSELLLLARRLHAAGRRFAVLITQPNVARTFGLANVTERFAIYHDRELALRALGASEDD